MLKIIPKIFAVPDFVGDACKAIASRVRGAVARTTFDNFHKHSADLIREAVFGKEGSDIKNRFIFQQNNLVITNIDIQSVEPVDSRTRDALQKSVQLAIEITTKSQEATAKHEAERREQEARGTLERQKSRMRLLRNNNELLFFNFRQNQPLLRHLVRQLLRLMPLLKPQELRPLLP